MHRGVGNLRYESGTHQNVGRVSSKESEAHSGNTDRVMNEHRLVQETQICHREEVICEVSASEGHDDLFEVSVAFPTLAMSEVGVVT